MVLLVICTSVAMQSISSGRIGIRYPTGCTNRVNTPHAVFGVLSRIPISTLCRIMHIGYAYMCRIVDSTKPCFSMLGVWTEMCCFHDITRYRKHDFRPPSTGTGYAMSTVCTHIPCSVYKYNTLYLVHYV